MRQEGGLRREALDLGVRHTTPELSPVQKMNLSPGENFETQVL